MESTTPRSPRLPLLAAPLLAALLLTAAAAPGQSLEARLNPLLASDQLKNAQVGVHIVEITPKGPVELYARNATTPLVPASCTKLLTTAAAFEHFGPKGALKTQLYQVGEDLLLVGSGDPGLGDAKLAAAAGGKVTWVFDAWAPQLRKAGLHTYRHLLVDDRCLDTQFVHPDWPKDQLLAWYEAPVGGLNFNANCLDWIPKLTPQGPAVELIPHTSYVTVVNKAARGPKNAVWLYRPQDSNAFELRGTLAASASQPESVTISDPGLWTGTILRDQLAAGGVTPTGTVRRVGPDDTFPNAKLLAWYQTPVTDLLRRANKNSMNMFAEALCKRLGYEASAGKAAGSWENGTAAVEAYVTKLGVKPDLLKLADGSGMSAQNRVAAQAFTTVLAHAAARPDGQTFVDSLAVPGEDGTLEKRFRDRATQAAGKGVHAKTGHIKAVSCLTGYLDVGPRRFAFSILCNKYQGNVNPLQDQIVAALHTWAGGKD